MHRVSSAINWSAVARYMTSNNYRKWNLVGGRGGPPEQLVDSDSQPLYICTSTARTEGRREGWRQCFIDETPNLQSGPGAMQKFVWPRRGKKNNNKSYE